MQTYFEPTLNKVLETINDKYGGRYVWPIQLQNTTGKTESFCNSWNNKSYNVQFHVLKHNAEVFDFDWF